MSEEPIRNGNASSGTPGQTAGGPPPAAPAEAAALAAAACAPTAAAFYAAASSPAGAVAPAASAKPTASAAPASASAAPAASRPERPARRVGTLTMGAALIVVGAAICTFQFSHDQNMLLLFCKLSPLLLVALGAEVLISAAAAKGARLKYDFLSMVVCFFLLVGALAASCLPLVLEYEGPGRSSAEMRVEQSIYDALYERLKDGGGISQIRVSAGLTYSGGYDAIQTAEDLKTGDRVYMTVELRGAFADKAAFVKACRPALEALRAQSLPGLAVNFHSVDPPEGGAPQYTMDLSGRYQLEMSDAELAQYVSEQIYVEEAGYYMTSEEAAVWNGSRQEEQQRLQEEIEALNDRLAEAEERAAIAEISAAEAQQENAVAEARAEELQQEVNRLNRQMEEVLSGE